MKGNTFSFFKAPIKNIYPLGEIDLSRAYEWIKHNYQSETEQVRTNPSLKAKILPYITPSGMFKTRNNNDLLQYSGIICIDLDHCDIRLKDTLSEDNFLNPALIFISPSGTGLKVFIAIKNATIEDHLKYFAAISQYLLNTYELDADKACKDVARACFLCHDPAAFYSEGTIDSEILLSILDTPPVLEKSDPENPELPEMAEIPEPVRQPSEQLNSLPIIHDRAVSALKNHDWQQLGTEEWVRPGKEANEGRSAIFNKYSKDGLYKFYNFSTNGHPFEVRGYTDVQVICVLEYSGNFTACIRDLSREYFPPFPLKEKANSAKKIEPLPIEGMPPLIREYVTTCSETFNTPRDFWAGAAIIATALGIGDKIQLVGRYTNVPILWMNCIGDVSSGKTEAIDFTIKPFEEIDSRAADQFKRDYKRYEEIESMSAKDRREAGIDRIARPACFQYILKDSTPEALNQVHSINQRGLMIARDELNGWLEDFGRYNKSGEQSNMLSSFNRVRWVTNRKSGGVDMIIEIPKPCILVVGGMQPDLIPKLAADNRAENGFLARFCNVWPDHAPKPGYSKSVVPEELKGRWNEYIINLTNIPEAINISLSEDAESLYGEWFETNAAISNKEESGYLKGVYGKLDIIALRLAIVIYGMNLCINGAISKEISRDEMKSALDITEYFRATALKVYDKLFGNNKSPDIKEIIKYLYKLGHSQTTIAGIMQKSQPYVNKVLKK